MDNKNVTNCEDCRNFNLILNGKEQEIQKLKLQIKKLNVILCEYQRKIKECHFCGGSEEEKGDNIKFDHVDHDSLESINNFTKVTSSKIKVDDAEACHKVDYLLNARALECNDSHEDTNSCASETVDENKQTIKQDSSVKHNHSEDYVYDESLKMYYCVSTGYYYDGNTGLFYVPQTGSYYKYDYDKNKYELCETHEPDTKTTEVCDSVVDKVSNLNLNDIDDNSSSVKKEPASPVLKSANGTNSEIHISIKIGTKQSTEDEISHDSTKDWQPPEGSNTTVTDLVREVAEQSSGMSDYIYDEKSKMYYCKSTGYFYDPIKKLLYDPQSRIYYLYIQETLSYEFYCKAESTSNSENKEVCSPEKNKGSDRIKARRKHWRKKQVTISDKKKEKSDCPLVDVESPPEKDSSKWTDDFSSPEDGELFSSDSETEQSTEVPEVVTEENTLVNCPPCIRAIVEESSKLKIGSLLLITCTGAQMGRKNANTISIPDIGVSKTHAEITFNNDSWIYSIADLGSQNGTFVNDLRLSKPKEKSEPQALNHGDKLTLGSCKLLLHIHEGYDTCDKCEPGQVMAEISSQEVKPTHVVKTKREKEKERRQEMRRLKRKYGLKGMEYCEGKNSAGSGYEDKAEIRRSTVGSQNPYEKTEVASMEMVMPTSNKGYQMLKKLGWKEGDSLGLTGTTGISEPIPLRPWVSKAGLGSTDMTSSRQALPEDSRKRKWVKAQERYFQLTS